MNTLSIDTINDHIEALGCMVASVHIDSNGESASRLLVCFGELIDTTIKGLTILLGIWAGIDYHNCNLCDEMNQDSRHMLLW